MGQFILNGRNYSGITYANGCFIDTDNVVYSAFTFDSSVHTWTATEDCILTDNMYPPDNTTAYFIRIDGKQVFAGYSTVEDPFVYVKKGQVVEYRAKSDSTMKAYGIQQGSNITFLSEYASACYDTNEREVGCWIDGKPLYQRTWEFGSSVLVSYSSWTNTTVDSSDIENIITVKAKHADGTCFEGIMADPTVSGHTLVGLQTTRNGAEANVKTLTLQYTKISDVAGSGKLTTTGMPTVHYDDTERIIGTWFGETLYQKTVVYNNPTLGRVDDLPHNIANIDTITKVEWIAFDSSGSVIIGHENNDSNWWADFFVVTRAGVSYRIGGSWGVTKIVVTLQYTKSS